MSDKIQGFNPNVVEELRTAHEDRLDYSLSDDEIDKLFTAIDYWRHGQQKEHELVIQAFNAQKLSFFVYQLKSERTMNTSLSLKDQLNNYVFGLVGEVGEVVDLLKKFFYHGHEVDSNRLKSELGDILWYVSAVASLFNINLQEIAQGNVEKLERRYPEGFSSEASIKREKREATMTEDITVKVIRHNPKDPSLYITGDMLDALRVFHERVAAHSQTGRLAVSKVELWVGDRLIKYADKDGVFDVKYTKAGVYQGVEEVNE